MKNLAFVILVSILVQLLPGVASAKLYCALANEKHALDTRALQSHFMVAALACGEQKKYNSFVKKFQTELVESGKYLKDYFRRNYSGNESENKMNQFITALANETSKRSLEKNSARFCAEAIELFKKTESGRIKRAYDLAVQSGFEKVHKISACN